ncbi:MAG: GTPase ObgE [Planctomycetota bacterium]
MLHDEADIEVRSGDGGAGCVSFRREKYIPEGGPDGGDGGRGGDVVLLADDRQSGLGAFVRKHKWRARNGQPGMGRKRSGARGEDAVLRVPVGTLVRHGETEALIADLDHDGARVVVAAGGKGGWGNTRYKTATNQAPRQHGHGEQGVGLPLHLELKLIADVGLIGFPNAGKSTLLSRLSRARPKVAAYPFTTLEPQLGVIERPDRAILLADIPGLVAGAAEGVGLGHTFLRHVERCALLVHLVDGTEGSAQELFERIRVLDAELCRFSAVLAAKRQLVVLNKGDTRADLDQVAQELSAALAGALMCSPAPVADRPDPVDARAVDARAVFLPGVAAISGVSGQGVEQLANRLLALVPDRETM